MTKYVQYDEYGVIFAVVISNDIPAPVYDRQLILDDFTDTTGKIVDIENKVLTDAPIVSVTPDAV